MCDSIYGIWKSHRHTRYCCRSGAITSVIKLNWYLSYNVNWKNSRSYHQETKRDLQMYNWYNLYCTPFSRTIYWKDMICILRLLTWKTPSSILKGCFFWWSIRKFVVKEWVTKAVESKYKFTKSCVRVNKSYSFGLFEDWC